MAFASLIMLLTVAACPPDSNATSVDSAARATTAVSFPRFASEIRVGLDGFEFQQSFFPYYFTSADLRVGIGPSSAGVGATLYPVKYFFGQLNIGLPRYMVYQSDVDPFKPDYYYSYRIGALLPLGRSAFYVSVSGEKMWMVDTRNCVNCGFLAWAPGEISTPEYRKLMKIVNTVYVGLGWRF